jgi:hypothetical protein
VLRIYQRTFGDKMKTYKQFISERIDPSLKSKPRKKPADLSGTPEYKADYKKHDKPGGRVTFEDAVVLSKYGKDYQLGHIDKNGKKFYGDSQFKFRGTIWQVYPSNQAMGYMAVSKKEKGARSFNLTGFNKEDFKEMIII